uniref:Protein SDA1 n=1 Tax=Rhizophora mucronata TaxID=61149 RepID=A0A2P2IYR4_RHIMU
MATANQLITGVSADALSASGLSSDKLSLPALQSKMKIDPEGYETELSQLYSQFNSALDLFRQQAALSFTSTSGVSVDCTISKDLGDRAMFLAHMTPFYLKQLSKFPSQLAEFLNSSARSLPSGLRCHVAQALILLINRKMVDIGETLALFIELQTLGDRNLRQLAFSHVVHSIRRMNKKHKNEAKNRALQNILFPLLRQENEALAKRSLTTLCELHRRKVWFDDRTANAICMACFHSSSRIMIAALSFLLNYEKIENEDDGDSDASSDDGDSNQQLPQNPLSKEAVYKAFHKGTVSSKKKKKAKLQRAIRSMKRQQRLSLAHNSSNNYSPVIHLKDPQGFAEKLFSRLQTCNERFEIKMMMLKVIARTVGLHKLILLNFYPYLQKYIQPHQRDITNLLAATVQACHDMVPPDAVEPLFKQLVNQFVHDRSRPEAIAVGLNVIRELCLRMPLLMTEDLLQDLVLYKKTHEKAVSVAARSLVTLFREVCPSLLLKKDRGRPSDPKARPKAYGEVSVASNVPGVELLQQDNSNDDDGDNEDDDDDIDDLESAGLDDDDAAAATDEENEMMHSDDPGSGDWDGDGQEHSTDEDGDDGMDDTESDASDIGGDEEDDNVDEEDSEEEVENKKAHGSCNCDDSNVKAVVNEIIKSKGSKRKLSDFDGQLIAADTSLRALKRLADEKLKCASSDSLDGFLSNEDFQRIKELKAKKAAKVALARQGFKVPSSDQLSSKRVDPAKLENHVRKKMSKQEKLALVKAGREDRGKYQSRVAVKKKKTGGLSNQQKEHKKLMPSAAKKAKIARSRQEKMKKQRGAGKQFSGRKAWKYQQ